MSISSISSTKSGFPSAASRIRARASSASSASPRRLLRRSSVSATGQRLEEHRSRVHLPAAPGRPSVEQVGSGEADQQDRRVARQVRNVVDQVEERRLGPVHVVEDDDERLLSCDGFEQLARGEKQFFRRGGAFVEQRPRTAARSLRAELVEHLEERPEGDPVPVRKAASGEDARCRPELVEEPCDKSRLPHTCRPQDREQVACPLVTGADEGLTEDGLLAAAADDRRVQLPRDRLGADVYAEESPRAQRLCFTLRGHRAGELGRDCIRQKAMGCIADQDHSGLGGLLEPGSDVDGVSRDERVARTGDDFARIDADPGLKSEVRDGLLAARARRGRRAGRRPRGSAGCRRPP